MSPTKLFITGATGYIGGSVLEAIIKKHPILEIYALLRAPTEEFTSRYPKVKTVKGTFDDTDVIERASEDADITIHTGDIDHPGCAKAILAGLAKKESPGFLIHLSGTGCISDVNEQAWEGKLNQHQWHDIAEIDEIYNLPTNAAHHEIDRWIMDANNELIKTAIICPPDIYGQNTGVGVRQTFLIPRYIAELFRNKRAFYLGEGNNIRAVTHIDDVVDMFLLLLEHALQGGGTADWGKEGFYFACSDSIRWKDAAEAINKIAQEQGWLPKDSRAVSWTKEQVGGLVPSYPRFPLYLWGSNSRAESARARKLGWKPHGPSFWEALASDSQIAMKRLEGVSGKDPKVDIAKVFQGK